MDRVVLGTVQFGLDYGINNKQGKPEHRASLEMLETAWEKGVRIYDTARAYGNAEEILGDFIRTHGLTGEIKVTSKLEPNILERKEPTVAMAEEEIYETLERLGIDSLHGYLYHTPHYVRIREMVDAFRGVRELGLTQKIGVSIYEENDALFAAKLDEIDHIQVPYGIFDQRMDRCGFFDLAKKNGKEVFARSAFLQGLVFMNGREIPENISEARNYVADFDRLIQPYGINRAEASLLFSFSNPAIDGVVFGVDNRSQLLEDLEIAERVMDSELLGKLRESFLDIEKKHNLSKLVEEVDMKVLAVIQARMGASRLPGKVLMDLSRKTVLERVVDRVAKATNVDEIVVATTIEKGDLPVVAMCASKGISVFPGSENDVLDRFYQAARLLKADHIVRITADCPLMDTKMIEKVVDRHLECGADYTANVNPPTFPDGLDVEVFTFASLERAWKEARMISEREHVTPYIRNRENGFVIENVENGRDLSDKRWTLDEEADYRFIKGIYEAFEGRNDFSMDDVLDFLSESREMESINHHIERNEGLRKSIENDGVMEK